MKNKVSEDCLISLLLDDHKNVKFSEVILDNREELSNININDFKDSVIDFELNHDSCMSLNTSKKPKTGKKYKMHSPDLKLKCLELVINISYT